MPRSLSPATRLDSLRKEARRWLASLRRGDGAARSRYDAAWPGGPAEPALRDVQHALSRDYGHDSWVALKAALTAREGDRAARLDTLLRSAWDGGDPAAAARLLVQDPSLAQASLHAAAMAGDLAEVRRRLAEKPAAAREKAGSRQFEPLQYLAYGRLPGADRDAVAIAEVLLDAGANAKAEFDDGWGNPFTVLTGVIGEGEGDRPAHPQAEALAELLIARGADPFDTQALYNTSITRDDTTWLERLYDHCVRQGTQERWLEVGQGLSGKHPQAAIDYLFGNAVTFNHPQRAAWLLQRGANVDGVNAYSGRSHLYEARLRGFSGMAGFLVRNEASRVDLSGAEAFQSAVLAHNEQAARKLAQADPAVLRDPGAILAASERGLAPSLRLLLDLGVQPDIADGQGVRPLHQAAGFGGPEVVRMLLEVGAEVDAREQRFGATPLGWAIHMGRPDSAEVLAPVSSDVVSLTRFGALERLGAVLDGASDSAKRLLFHLPDHEARALEVTELLLSRGADPKARDGEGRTAAEAARARGLIAAADRIDRAP